MEAGVYLLACQRYIELNPARAGMVQSPGDYAWSSCRANALGAGDPVVTGYSSYTALGAIQINNAKRHIADCLSSDRVTTCSCAFVIPSTTEFAFADVRRSLARHLAKEGFGIDCQDPCKPDRNPLISTVMRLVA